MIQKNIKHKINKNIKDNEWCIGNVSSMLSVEYHIMFSKHIPKK